MERSIPLSAIDVGGQQTAPDGGIDAQIEWQDGPEPSGWLPRRHIVLQCKATGMAPAAIKSEMRPKDALRPFFADLASSGGAYIIATTENVGSTAVKARTAAMRDALNGLSGQDRVALEIYTADKLARWANSHVGVAMWLRETSGHALMGWRPFEAWSQGGSQPYLLDGQARASIGGASDTKISHAIEAMRWKLAQPRESVRLVGISGMGKTRLAEALFDGALEYGSPLTHSSAVYGDAGHDLATPPALVAERLAASGQRAVLIVDNCTDRLHGQLARIVAQRTSRTSLLTIDYELDGDTSEGALVVRLGDNSDTTIDNLIAQRFPDLGGLVRHRLVEFAGGNARVALAIARGVRKSDRLTDLDDFGLIDRLFQEERRGGRDATMRPAAEVAALVYAFYADATERSAPEHGTLAPLAELSAKAFYAAVERMLSFGIAQQRGAQRAIKPDALADRLASICLRQSEPASLVNAFAGGPPRLHASFARRIGRLHNEPKAVAIANMLLSEDGWLGDIAAQDDLQQLAFMNIAPAAREAALEAIERAITDKTFMTRHVRHRAYADVLANIAWDPLLFRRAMTSLRAFALAAPKDSRDKQVRELFLERFRPGLSFTMAAGCARLAVIDELLDQVELPSRELAVDALDAMLESGNVSSSFDTDFGTRNQNSEWRWQTVRQRSEWFENVYRRLSAISAANTSLSDRARNVVAENARTNAASGVGLLTAQAIQDVRQAGYWDDGWRAVNDVLHFDRQGLPPEVRTAFETLEQDLRPKSLEQCFEAFVLGEPWRHWHPRGDERRHTRDVQLLARGCGVAAARSGDLVSWLARATGAAHRQGPHAFGRGLASRTADLDRLWESAVAAFRQADPGARGPALLAGIIEAAWVRNRNWAQAHLAELAADPDLARFIVTISPPDAFDASWIDRLIAGLDSGLIPPEMVGGLMFGGISKEIAAPDLARLINRLIDHPDGAVTALNILFMRRFGDAQDGRPSTPELDPAARRLLADSRLYELEHDRIDHELAGLARPLLPDAELARAIARAILTADRSGRRHLPRLSDLKRLLIESNLEVALNEFVLADEEFGRIDGIFSTRFSDDSRLGEVVQLDEEIVLRWMEGDPQVRAPKLARLVPYATTADDGASLSWSPLAMAIVRAAPDPSAILKTFEDRFYSGVSTGPFYLRFVRRMSLIDQLRSDPDPVIRRWAAQTGTRLEKLIAQGQQQERDQESLFE